MYVQYVLAGYLSVTNYRKIKETRLKKKKKKKKKKNCKGGYLANTSKITEMQKCVSMFIYRITWDF